MIVFHEFPPKKAEDLSLTELARQEYLYPGAGQDELWALGVFVGSTLYENLLPYYDDDNDLIKVVIKLGQDVLMRHARVSDWDLWPSYNEALQKGMPLK